MKTSLMIAVAAALSAGAALAACGSGSSASTGSAGTGAGSGTGGTGGHGGSAGTVGTMSTGVGGIGFEGGVGDSAPPDGDACGSVALMTHLTPGNVVVVFDQSNSMKNNFTDADGGVAGVKWQIAEQALVAALTPDEALINAGAIFFPSKAAVGNACATVDLIGVAPQIKIEPGASFVTDFQAHFSAPGWDTILDTPLQMALANADLALPDPSPLKGQRAVVILTDGAPTCDTVEADILAPVKDMFSRGIKTYAVGLPGSAAAMNLLNDIAAAGGTMNYLSPGDPTALQNALAKIASGTVDKCTVTLSPPPTDPNEVYLFVTDAANPQGVEIPRGDGGDGWTLSPDGTTATLDGAVCTMAKAGDYTTIQFVYGCPVLP
jgi:hypothetical protein